MTIKTHRLHDDQGKAVPFEKSPNVSSGTLEPKYLHLQRTIGNQAVLGRLPALPDRTKLTVNPLGDLQEQEADRVADEVARKPSGRSGDSAGSATKSRPGHDGSPTRAHAATRSSTDTPSHVETGLWHAMGRQEGRPIPHGVRRHYEAAYGSSFSSVRIHTGPLARSISTSLRADGVTDGRNIALRRPKFGTAGTASPRVLAHELAHVRQQQGRSGPVLYRVPWTVDEGHYYPDRGGAVARGRKLGQTYMSIDVFEREDGNWQVRYRHGVPQPESYPAVDTGLYYTDQAGAERRASHLRAYGFVVEVFQRPDDNWQCRLLRLQGATPALPTSTGPDAGFYYTARTSAERRAEALRAAGFTVTVVERNDGNFQADISALPTYPDSGPAIEQGEQAVDAAEPAAGEAAEAAEGGAADVHERVAGFVGYLNTELTALRNARLVELREAAPDDADADAITLPTIDVTIAAREERTPQDQARNIIEGRSWTCRSAHLGDNARHVLLRIDGAVTWHPQTDIENDFGEDFYDDFVEAWNEAMADNDLRNYRGEEGWAPGDAYHLEMPVRNVLQSVIDECIEEYVRLTREEGEDQVESIEDLYEDEIQALLEEDE